MSSPNKNLEIINKIFGSLNSNDPKIKMNGEKIIFSPFYWNYSFVTNFLPLFAAAYIIIQQGDRQINLICVLIIIGSVCLIISELNYYNNVTVDTTNKIITIQPNVLYMLIRRKKIVSIKDIKKINFKSTAFWPAFRRYLITLTLKNSEVLKLISTKEKKMALEITQNLFLLF